MFDHVSEFRRRDVARRCRGGAGEGVGRWVDARALRVDCSEAMGHMDGLRVDAVAWHVDGWRSGSRVVATSLAAGSSASSWKMSQSARYLRQTAEIVLFSRRERHQGGNSLQV